MYPFIYISIFSIFLLFYASSTSDTLSSSQTISDSKNESLVSSNGNFRLGFFSPQNSPNRYIGIWYDKIPKQKVVWVANRESPLENRNGIFKISGNKNIALFDTRIGFDFPIWSSNISVANTNNTNTTAKLLSSGNLVLTMAANDIDIVAWQSFDYPTDTVLPGMRFGLNRKTGLYRVLTSWKSEDDPARGEFSLAVDPRGSAQFFLYKKSKRIWRGGPWNGLTMTGVPNIASVLSSSQFNFSTDSDLFNYTFVNNQYEVYITFESRNSSHLSTLVVEPLGTVQRQAWRSDSSDWRMYWMAPQDLCDEYARCGSYAICNSDKTLACSCLPGYKPQSFQDWALKCVEKRKLSSCGKGKGEGFLKISNVKIPDATRSKTFGNMSLDECGKECLRSCECSGYAKIDIRKSGNDCLVWYGNLSDMRHYAVGGQDFYLRVDAIELADTRKNSKNDHMGTRRTFVMLFVAVGLAIILLIVCCFCVCLKTFSKNKGLAKEVLSNREMLFMKSFSDSSNKESTNGYDESTKFELTFFDLDTLTAATCNFSSDNMLGKGGFGPVYKGKLSDGQEIAVKRLSKNSGQGIKEFKNEAVLIAKLQHRNLVKLVGCCVDDEEKILIYEYMLNKSLDYFIFDENRKSLLDWKKRFDIILGIARGMLYLHQDSRLRIIHRDLKASNILLDGELEPKISDFGTARIFGRDENQANTNRVVGTYGYMSPEYALDGLFSTKSDVFSFGVLLLEIISGEKNAGFSRDGLSWNLIRYAWELWSNEKTSEIVDSSIGDSCIIQEVLRCIQVGLLCVQDSPGDRPTMSNVVFMLSNETTLPSPKEPTFFIKRTYIVPDPITLETNPSSVNELTITTLDAR